MDDTQLNKRIVAELNDESIENVKVAIVDIDGILRGKYLNKEKFLSSLASGFGFCSVVFGWDCNDACYDKGLISGLHNGYPDVNARVDLTTYRRIPWDNQTPFFLADVNDKSGEALAACSRSLLKIIIARAEKMGFNAKFGVEYEWFNFNESATSLAARHYVEPKPISPGMFGYSILRQSHNQPFFHAMLSELNAFQIPIEGLHTETGPGVLEAAILYSDALEAADRGVLFKSAVKEIAHRFEILPSFMARFSDQLPGCGGHLHQSLWDKNSKNNLFFDDKDQKKMSKIFKNYLAGQLKLLPEILPFFAPNINSYKRLVEGFWAPTKVTWGDDNRTTAVRVIPAGAKSTRMEWRVSGADINPYMSIAACLAAGLWGIENEIPLELPETIGSAYTNHGAVTLPRNLHEATVNLSRSKVAREIFGDAFVEHFVNTRLWEWRTLEKRVSTLERERYFEII